MLKRALTMLAAIPVAIVLVALAVSNRKPVELILDPFRPEDPALSLALPLYVVIFGALLAGVALGGVASWLGQGKWRRTARMRAQDAMRWQAEADRLSRERDERHGADGSRVGSPPARALAVARRA